MATEYHISRRSGHSHFESPNMPKAQRKRFVVCVDNDGYPVSLERREIYIALSDSASEKLGLLRIVDESGEDYLYPRELLRAVALSPSVKKAV